MVRFQCPKCGGMYLQDGRCTTCGYAIASSPQKKDDTAQQAAEQSTKPRPSSNLMYCPDCGKIISKDAYACPQCGCPFPGNFKGITQQTKTQSKPGLGFFGTIVAIVVSILIIWYIAAPYSTPLWLQHIGGIIKGLLTGKTSYTIFDPTNLH